MHILLVQFYANPTPVLDELAKKYRSVGHTAWVGSCNTDGDLVWNDGNQNVAIQRGPSNATTFLHRVSVLRMVVHRFAYLAFILRVRRFLKESNADVVQINKPMFASLLPLGMPRNMQFLLDVRQIGEWDDSGLLGRFKSWRAVTRSKLNARFFYDRGLFASVSAARRVLGDEWARWGSVTPIGVHERFLEYIPPSLVRRDVSHPVRFVYIGSISKLRRLEVLFSAIQRVCKMETNFHVTMLGPDHAGGYYHNLVDDMGLGKFITILPAVPYDDVPKAIWEHDVALAYVPDIPDWRYQPTLKVLEYRALGIPVLASDNEPNREIIQSGVNGIFVGNTAEDIARGMLKFINDRDFLFNCVSSSVASRSGRTWTEAARIHLDEVYIK